MAQRSGAKNKRTAFQTRPIAQCGVISGTLAQQKVQRMQAAAERIATQINGG